MHSDYYVYEWYIKDTGHVFYVGKGRLNRIDEIRNRNKYFLAKYKKYKCMARKIKEGLTNEEACELEKITIKQRKESGEAECNFTYGGDGFSEGDLNPMYGVKLCGELNGFYGRHHSQETKALISAKRKGKGGQCGAENPMYGKGFKGKENPMYGRTGLSHPNSKMYVLEGEEEPLTYKECEKRFGIAFSRIYKEGGILTYKKSCTNKKLYEGKLLTRVK